MDAESEKTIRKFQDQARLLVQQSAQIIVEPKDEKALADLLRKAFAGIEVAPAIVEGLNRTYDIGVYDIAGRLVQRLANGFYGGGIHDVQWDGRDQRGGRVGVGVYFVRGLIGERQVNSRVIMTQ